MVWDAVHQEIFNAIITEGEAMVRRSRDPRYAWLARRQRFPASDTARLRQVATKMPEAALREALASVKAAAAADTLHVSAAAAVIEAVMKAHAREHESQAVLRRLSKSKAWACVVAVAILEQIWFSATPADRVFACYYNTDNLDSLLSGVILTLRHSFRRVAESGRRRHRSLQNRLFLWLAALTPSARVSPLAAAIGGSRVAVQHKVNQKPRGQ